MENNIFKIIDAFIERIFPMIKKDLKLESTKEIEMITALLTLRVFVGNMRQYKTVPINECSYDDVFLDEGFSTFFKVVHAEVIGVTTFYYVLRLDSEAKHIMGMTQDIRSSSPDDPDYDLVHAVNKNDLKNLQQTFIKFLNLAEECLPKKTTEVIYSGSLVFHAVGLFAPKKDKFPAMGVFHERSPFI